MAFKLPDHIHEKLEAARVAEHHQRVVFANLSNSDLAASAKFFMAHCGSPKRFVPDEPIYDATFWYVIVPEILRRLSPDRKADETP